MVPRPLLLALVLASGCHKGAPEREPASSGAPAPAPAAAAPAGTAAGAKAPDAQVSQASGAKIALADVAHQHAQTVLVFYRGFW